MHKIAESPMNTGFLRLCIYTFRYFEKEKQKILIETEKTVIKAEKKKEKKQELPSAKFNLKEIKTEQNAQNAYFPESQSEIEDIVQYFAKGENATVDLSKFDDEDRAHALDLFSGAAFALGGQVKKTGESIYLLKH